MALYYAYKYFYPDEVSDSAPAVNPQLKGILDGTANFDEEAALQSTEEKKYGRALTPAERLAFQRAGQRTGVEQIGVDAVRIMKKEEHVRRQESRKECNWCCTVWSTMRIAPPIVGISVLFAWADIKAGRVKDFKASRPYMLAVLLPFISVTSVGGYFYSKSLHNLKPLDEGNYRRGMFYFGLGAFAVTSLPFGAYHVVKHHILRPKNISKHKYFSKINKPLVPFKTGQVAGLFKPWTHMSALEFFCLTCFYSLAVPLGMYLTALLSDGDDSVLLAENREFIYACVPYSLQKHVSAVLDKQKKERLAKLREEKRQHQKPLD